MTLVPPHTPARETGADTHIALPSDWTDVQRAAYATVHEFRRGHRRGAVALAPLVGKTPATLCNEVNPGQEFHKLGLEDSVVIQHATEDYRIVAAVASELGGVFARLPTAAWVSDMELLSQAAMWEAAMGETWAAIRDALVDGVISREEVAEVRRRFYHQYALGMGFLAHMEQIAEAGDA